MGMRCNEIKGDKKRVVSLELEGYVWKNSHHTQFFRCAFLRLKYGSWWIREIYFQRTVSKINHRQDLLILDLKLKKLPKDMMGVDVEAFSSQCKTKILDLLPLYCSV